MSGECGYHRSPILGVSVTGNNVELSKAASATLEKLNSMMKQMSDWRSERIMLQSNIQRLKSALKKSGKNPDDALRPDPVVVHQRSEINRLELTVDRLEDEVHRLREALLESDQAITCSGAKRLKEKMIKMREETAKERRMLKDEIGHLKLRVQEAEEDSSCSSLGRLRVKLREILNGDKKMERVIADVASRSCGTVIDLSNELTRMKELLDESSLENIRVNGESKRLKAALESAPNSLVVSGRSGYLETIERLGFHVKELERKIKEFEDDSGVVKRVEELEDALNENQKKLEDKEAVVTSLRNEIIGAKTAYKIKSDQLDEIKDLKMDYQALEMALKERDKTLTDLQRQLKLSASMPRDIQRLKDELNRVKSQVLNLEIEKDGAFDEIEKMRCIVSERNEHIVKILEENERVKNELCIASVNNERLKIRCDNLEEELFKLSELSKASGAGDLSVPLVKKIKELEEELKRLTSHPLQKKNSTDFNSEVKTLEFQVDKVKGSKVRVEKDLSDFRYRIDAENLTARFIERLNKLKTDNIKLKNEVDELRGKIIEINEIDKIDEKICELKSKEIQTEDYFQNKLSKLEIDNTACKLDLGNVIAERDALKSEFRKLICEKEELNSEITNSKIKINRLKETIKELNEEIKGCESLKEKLKMVEDRLAEASISLEIKKSSFDNLKAENEELKISLSKENEDRFEIVKTMEKLRLKVEEQSKTPIVKIEGVSESAPAAAAAAAAAETLVIDYDDYVRADRELKYYIHLQSLAIKRVVDFISYVDGRTSPRPAMANFLEPKMTDLIVLNIDENITATLKMSQKLSADIFQAEIDVQKLDALKNDRNNIRAERDCLNKGMERLSNMLSKLGREISIPRDVDVADESFLDGVEFCPDNKIRYLQTTNGEKNFEDDKFLAINRRISTLQYQIQSKQHEAAQRLIEMRETMREERIRLMEIADRENPLLP